MASRKNLKKDISLIIEELITECMIRSQLVPGTDKAAADALILELIETDADFTSRISHTEPGDAKKYYAAFFKDFNKQIESIIEKIESLSKK